FLQLWRLDSRDLNNTKLSGNELLFFNPVPRTGSETLVKLLQILGERNHFGLERQPLSRPVINHLNLLQRKSLVHYATKLTKNTAFAFVESVGYINFRSHKLAQPIYVNLVRDPVEKVISWYYHKRTPWNAVQVYQNIGKFQKRDFYMKSFESCVLNDDPECRYDYAMGFHGDSGDHKRQSLFFCGHAPLCEPFNIPAAIARAKHNVERDFAVVGSWEDVNVTLTVLEHYVPRFFRGVTELYFETKYGFALSHYNHWKPQISEHIKSIVRANFTMEYEFYNFCKQRLYRQYFAINRHLEL
ncbi:hypothetical protein KR222_008436, partial [Zaprionus bogoriensis]